MMNFKKLMRQRRGGIIITGAAAIALIMLLVGGAVDIALYTNAQRKMANAADSALLSAAAVAKTRDINEVAKNFFDANFPRAADEGITLQDFDVNFDESDLRWTADVNADFKPFFASFLGIDEIDLQHKVDVVWDINRRMDVVFTLDTSASMCMDALRSVDDQGQYHLVYRPDHTCKKLNFMKTAMAYVIENGLTALQGDAGPVFYAGIVPFNHKIRFPNENNVPDAFLASERTFRSGDRRYYNIDPLDDGQIFPIIPLTPIGSNAQKTTLVNAINDIDQKPEGEGWTRSNIGLLAAAMMLDPDQQQFFGGSRAGPLDKDKTDKVVVMMSDGANVGCCFASHPGNDPQDYENQFLHVYLADNAHMKGVSQLPELRKFKNEYNLPEKGLCDQMKENGITIYTVLYDVDDRDPGGKAIKDAFSYCASNEQFFFDVQTDEDLDLAYKTISQSFLRLRIDY